MKKSIKNIEAKAVKNTNNVKGGNWGDRQEVVQSEILLVSK